MVHKCRGSFVYQSQLFMLILGTNNKHMNNPLLCAMSAYLGIVSAMLLFTPLHIQTVYKLQPNEVTMGPSGHMSAPGHRSGNISITRDTVH